MNGDVDPVAAARALGLPPVTAATALARNRGKAVWRLDTDTGPVALRVLREGDDDVAAHEVRLMRLARDGGMPVPDVVAAGTVLGRPVLVLSWCAGRTARDLLRRRPWQAHAVGVACGRAQAALHAVEVPGVEQGWADRLGRVDDALATALAALTPRPALVHLDFHLENVMLDAGRLSGVVDWTNAGLADARADLARSWALLVVAPTGRRPAALVARAVDRVVARGWRIGYEQAAGPVSGLAVFRAWAGTSVLAGASDERDGRRRQVLLRRVARLRREADLPAGG